MNPEEIRNTIFKVLGEIAPEADPAALPPDAPIREELDLDSMDFLNFVIGICEALKLEIPESDYPKLATMEGCLTHLASLVGARGGESPPPRGVA